jgi:Uma2 family endonuclease
MGAKTLLTFEEFERLPDQPGKRELLKGELVELPPAKYRHNKLAELILERVKAAVRAAHARGLAADLGESYREMGYQLERDSYVQPDASVTHAGQTVTPNDYLWGAPAIAIEVISPSNTAQDIDFKIQLYFEFGACEAWVVHPKTGHVVVHTAQGLRKITAGELLTTPLIPGLQISVGDILAD